MSFLAGAVKQMIAGMEPEQRREAIYSVASEVLEQMTEAERAELAQQLFGLLLTGLSAETRQTLASDLGHRLTAPLAS